MKAVRRQGFDRLSPNGAGNKPFALSPNGAGRKPFALSPNGAGPTPGAAMLWAVQSPTAS